MNLLELTQRDPNPQPWAEGEKIPWNEPAFSQRMLKEHLSQQHDAASRRKPRIKKHVDWIHKTILAGKESSILDLGCGPGLYCAELSARGHVCHGIDFSPASIEYATKHSPERCSYQMGDLRTEVFGAGYDLVMFIFGEFNVFRAADARAILKKAHAALKPGGQMLIEMSTFDAIEQIGNQPAMWYSSPGGLFSQKPHLCLMENFWDEERSIATERYFIMDAETNQVTRYSSSSHGYDEGQVKSMMREAGFRAVEFHPSLTGKSEDDVDDFWVVTAQK